MVKRTHQNRYFVPKHTGLACLGKPHTDIDFVHEKRYMFIWGCWWGGGGFAAVTFLCKISWKNSIVFSKAFNISESSLQNIKKKTWYKHQSVILYLKHSNFNALKLSISQAKNCFEKHWKFWSLHINKKTYASKWHIPRGSIANTGQ
jgi:hypothetical protein